MADNTQPVAVMAKLLDLSERRIQQLSREGIIPKSQRSRYELVGSVKGYIHYLRDLALKADHGIAVVVNPFWPPFNVKTDNSVPSYSVIAHHCGYGVSAGNNTPLYNPQYA